MTVSKHSDQALEVQIDSYALTVTRVQFTLSWVTESVYAAGQKVGKQNVTYIYSGVGSCQQQNKDHIQETVYN